MLLAQITVSAACFGGILFAIWLAFGVLRAATGTSAAEEISEIVISGTTVFLVRLYTTALVVSTFAALAVGAVAGVAHRSVEESSLAFLATVAGALTASIAGFAGAVVAVRAGSRTAAAAKDGLMPSARHALRGGLVPGLLMGSLSLGGVAGLFGAYSRLLGHSVDETPLLLVAFGLGASSVALLAQLGGGTFARAADLGAELVSNIDANVPDRVARNPAVTADFVGDQLSDGVGRGADLFQSLSVANIGALILGAVLFTATDDIGWALLPLVLPAVALLAAMVAMLALPLWASRKTDPSQAVVNGFWVVASLSAVGLAMSTFVLLGDAWHWFFLSGLVGIAAGITFFHLTLYYAAGVRRPGKDIAAATEIGTAPNLLMGTTVGLEAVAVGALTVGATLIGSFILGQQADVGGASDVSTGVFGVAVAALGMLMTGVYVLAISSMGAVADNAAGLIELTEEPSAPSQEVARSLDATGKTARTAARGLATGSTALVAFVLFAAFLSAARAELATTARQDPTRFVELAQDLDLIGEGVDLQAGYTNSLVLYLDALEQCELDDETFESLAIATRFEAAARRRADSSVRDCQATVDGSPLPLPAMLPLSLTRAEIAGGAVAGLAIAFAFASFAIRGVWETAGRLVQEVRRQFASGFPATAGEQIQPDHGRAMAVTSDAAFRHIVRPVLLTVGLFVALGVGLRFVAGESGNSGWLAVTGMLAFGGIAGVFLASYFDHTGAALDNGRRVIESGFLVDDDGETLGPGSDPHAASLAGSVFGGPLRGVAGPSLHVLVKLLGVTALALVPIFVG